MVVWDRLYGLRIVGMLGWGGEGGLELVVEGNSENAGVCVGWRDLLGGYGYVKLLREDESDLQKKDRSC